MKKRSMRKGNVKRDKETGTGNIEKEMRDSERMRKEGGGVNRTRKKGKKLMMKERKLKRKGKSWRKTRERYEKEKSMKKRSMRKGNVKRDKETGTGNIEKEMRDSERMRKE